MTKRMMVLALAVVLAGLPALMVRAELPPGSYDKLRAEADEALIIEVTAVTVKTGKAGVSEVTVDAKILSAERSKSGLKTGGAVMIVYTHMDLSKMPGFAGPRQVPMLEKGKVYPAFLKKSENGKALEPAAYGESFVMTPEG